jgi:hypothetical protein
MSMCYQLQSRKQPARKQGELRGYRCLAPLGLLTQLIGRRTPAMISSIWSIQILQLCPSHPHGKNTLGFFLALSFSLCSSDGSDIELLQTLKVSVLISKPGTLWYVYLGCPRVLLPHNLGFGSLGKRQQIARRKSDLEHRGRRNGSVAESTLCSCMRA